MLSKRKQSISLKKIVSSESFLINLTSDTKNGVLREMCGEAVRGAEFSVLIRSSQ